MGLGTGAAVGIAGAVTGGVMQANAAGNASAAQVSGAQAAQSLEAQQEQNALDFQNKVWSGTQTAEQPYQNLGRTSSNNLTALLTKGFQAPTLAQAEQNPGYQFQLQQGTTALDQSAAARGNLFSGTQGRALTEFGQNLAQTDYQQVYQNALQGYMANYSTLLGGTNVGLQSTGQLAQAGQNAANTTANIDLTGGAQQASQINNAAAARASGYIGQANAYSNMVNGITQDVLGPIGTQNPIIQSAAPSPSEMAAIQASQVQAPPINPLAQSPYFNPFQSSYGQANS